MHRYSTAIFAIFILHNIQPFLTLQMLLLLQEFLLRHHPEHRVLLLLHLVLLLLQVLLLLSEPELRDLGDLRDRIQVNARMQLDRQNKKRC